MLKLRATHLSDDWDAYWEWHVQQDQQRLHRTTWQVVPK
jgi:hypothetical protein